MEHWAKMGSYTWGAAQYKFQSSVFTNFVYQKISEICKNVETLRFSFSRECEN